MTDKNQWMPLVINLTMIAGVGSADLRRVATGTSGDREGVGEALRDAGHFFSAREAGRTPGGESKAVGDRVGSGNHEGVEVQPELQ